MQDLTTNILSFDWELSLHLAADNLDSAKELFVMMIDGLPAEKPLINAAFASKNLKQLRDAVHRLHGSCCYTGFSKLKHLTKNLEQSIIIKNLEQIDFYIKLLNQEIDVIINKYNHQFLETLCF